MNRLSGWREISDASLLEYWRQGEIRAGQELFSRYYGAVKRFIRNKVADSHQDDLVQRVFEALVCHPERVAQNASFRNYVFAIAHRTVCDHYRKLARRSQRMPKSLDFDKLSADQLTGDPERFTLVHEEQHLLLMALRRISLNQQIAIELHFWEGLPAWQIARIVGAPEGTIKNRIRSGKRALLRIIGRMATTPEQRKSTLDDLDKWCARMRNFSGYQSTESQV